MLCAGSGAECLPRQHLCPASCIPGKNSLSAGKANTGACCLISWASLTTLAVPRSPGCFLPARWGTHCVHLPGLWGAARPTVHEDVLSFPFLLPSQGCFSAHFGCIQGFNIFAVSWAQSGIASMVFCIQALPSDLVVSLLPPVAVAGDLVTWLCLTPLMAAGLCVCVREMLLSRVHPVTCSFQELSLEWGGFVPDSSTGM